MIAFASLGTKYALLTFHRSALLRFEPDDVDFLRRTRLLKLREQADKFRHLLITSDIPIGIDTLNPKVLN